MGELLRINPPLSFPIGEVFRVPDTFNGKERGEFYFRSPFTHNLHGPFHDRLAARTALCRDHGYA